MAWRHGTVPAKIGMRAYSTRSVPYGHWKNPENRRAFMDKLASDLGVRQAKDWKGVSIADIKARGGAGLLKMHGDSLLRTLQATYPEQRLDAHVCRRRVPQGYWDKQEHRRAFLAQVRDNIGVQPEEGWQRLLTADHVKAHGGSVLLRMFGNVRRLIADTYPELAMEVVERKPLGHWAVRQNRKAFLDQFAIKHGIRGADAWATVTLKMVKEFGGGGMLGYYSNSLQRALDDIYPDLPQSSYDSLGKRRRGYWDHDEHRRAFLDKYAESRGIVSQEDWKKASWRDIHSAGGGGLLSKYSSIQEALADVYEGEWATHVCRARVPHQYWEDDRSIRSFLDKAKKELSIREDDDWYRVSLQQVRSLNGGGLLARMTLRDALVRVYGMEWDDSKSPDRTGKRSSQRLLLGHMTDIFGGRLRC